jgi:hypothetical protein
MQTQHIVIIHLQPIHCGIGLQIALELIPATLRGSVNRGPSAEGAAVVEVAYAGLGVGELFEDEEPGKAGDAGDGAFVDLWEMVFSVSVSVSIPIQFDALAREHRSAQWYENDGMV